MRETGTIQSVDPPRMMIRLQAHRPEMCARCRACEVFAADDKSMLLRAAAVEGLVPGDRVAVDVPEPSPWAGIVLLLALPLALMVGGLVLGSQWTAYTRLLPFDPEFSGAILGVALAGIAFLFARRIDRRYHDRITVTRLDPAEDPLETDVPDTR